MWYRRWNTHRAIRLLASAALHYWRAASCNKLTQGQRSTTNFQPTSGSPSHHAVRCVRTQAASRWCFTIQLLTKPFSVGHFERFHPTTFATAATTHHTTALTAHPTSAQYNPTLVRERSGHRGTHPVTGPHCQPAGGCPRSPGKCQHHYRASWTGGSSSLSSFFLSSSGSQSLQSMCAWRPVSVLHQPITRN